MPDAALDFGEITSYLAGCRENRSNPRFSHRCSAPLRSKAGPIWPMGDASVIGAAPGPHINSNYEVCHEVKVRSCPRSRPGGGRECVLGLDRLERQTYPEPTVEYEIHYEPHEITVSRACKLVWNCTDIVPGLLMDQLLNEGLAVKRRTYAACARAIVEDIESRRTAG